MGRKVGSEGFMPIRESVKGILKVVQSLEETDSGKCFMYDGSSMPW